MSVTNPPVMEDSPELIVDSIQEGVRPFRPALLNGGHGGHVALQAKEILLHLERQTFGLIWFLCFEVNL